MATEAEIAAGESIAVEGDFGHCLDAVASATADVIAGDVTIRSVGPGDGVGEIAVLALRPPHGVGRRDLADAGDQRVQA